MRYLIVLVLIFNLGCIKTDLSSKGGEILLDPSDGYNQELKQLSDEITK
jgi:hypothetical protein